MNNCEYKNEKGLTKEKTKVVKYLNKKLGASGLMCWFGLNYLDKRILIWKKKKKTEFNYSN